MKEHEYTHYVNYYETDRMGITHHSNYVRWMEEARLSFLDSIGWSLLRFEEEGVVSPVVSLECRYKKTTTFGDNVKITVKPESFNGVKLSLSYLMKNEEDEIVFEGSSMHCFLDRNGYPLRMKKDYPEFYESLRGLLE
ncbi:MAG: acyl-CoA thioesterase [Lachnospiraceae bacterium]|nr:acyl-CoA thioesterase [Lachnospiraceae bacterium]